MKRTFLTMFALLSFGVAATYAASWFCGWRVLYDLDSTARQAWRNRNGAADESDSYHVNAAVMYAMSIMRTRGAARVQVIALRADRAAVINAPDVQDFEQTWRDWGSTPATWSPLRRWSCDPPEVDLLREPYRTDMYYEARGWPMLATWCALDRGIEGGFHLGLGHIPGTFATTERVLPYRPIWFGFAVNTLFYASIFGLLRFAWRSARRRSRIARGRCAACGYIVAGLAVCPECGMAINASVD